MKLLAADFLLLALVVSSVFLPGVLLVRAGTRLRGIEALSFGAFAGIMLQAAFGLCLAFSRSARWPVLVLSGGATLAALVYLWRRNLLRKLWAELPRSIRRALALWLLFTFGCVAVTHLRPTLPRNLPNGTYVFKTDTLNVRLQYLTGLPSDNFLPYIVSEYFLRRISFRKAHPLLEGNEVSDRTILMSLVALPYRAAVAMPPRWKGPLARLPREQGRRPDVARLYRDDSYRQVLVVGIFLNSLLLLGLICAFAGYSLDPAILPAGALLYLTSAYAITQTIFIWPKALAGFFLLLCWHAARRKFHPAVVALCAALAYHSHPLALPFAGGMALFYFVRVRRNEERPRSFFVYLCTLLLLLAPWFFWTQLTLHLPSDLLWQNIAGPGTAPALAHPINFLWVRARNLSELFTPVMFFAYPFDSAVVAEAARNCLPGAVGLFLVYPALVEATVFSRPRALWWWGMVMPLALIVAVFSYPVPTIVHGFQAAVGGLIFWGTIFLRRNFRPAAFWSIVCLQLAVNLGFLAIRVQATGLHFP